MSIGENIKKWREFRNLKQTDLAELVGVSDKTVSSWEINRTEPKMGMIEKICIALNCKKTDIIGDDSSNNVRPVQLFYGLSAVKNKLNDYKIESDLQSMIETYYTIPDDMKQKLIRYALQLRVIYEAEESLKAAHERTDIEPTEEMKQNDNDIMNDPEF